MENIDPYKKREIFRLFDKHNYAERLLGGEELYIENKLINIFAMYAIENELTVKVTPLK